MAFSHYRSEMDGDITQGIFDRILAQEEHSRHSNMILFFLSDSNVCITDLL